MRLTPVFFHTDCRDEKATHVLWSFQARANVIKLFTVVSTSRKKLECSFLASLSALGQKLTLEWNA